MANKIPTSVIGAVSSVIAAHYYSHSKLNALFMESGASGDIPDCNCEAKCFSWLKRCNDDPSGRRPWGTVPSMQEIATLDDNEIVSRIIAPVGKVVRK